MKIKRKTNGVIAELEKFFDIVDQSLLVFDEGVKNYLHRDIKAVNENLQSIVKLENDSSLLQRDIEASLYRDEMSSNGDVLRLLERMRLIDIYDASDDLSMKHNNSSCFNYRTIGNTGKISAHGLGLAVDINPLYNPYWKKDKSGKELVSPAEGRPYVNRKASFQYKISAGDLGCRLFKAHGFVWGGDWRSCKDYQHFEKKN